MVVVVPLVQGVVAGVLFLGRRQAALEQGAQSAHRLVALDQRLVALHRLLLSQKRAPLQLFLQSMVVLLVPVMVTCQSGQPPSSRGAKYPRPHPRNRSAELFGPPCLVTLTANIFARQDCRLSCCTDMHPMACQTTTPDDILGPAAETSLQATWYTCSWGPSTGDRKGKRMFARYSRPTIWITKYQYTIGLQLQVAVHNVQSQSKHGQNRVHASVSTMTVQHPCRLCRCKGLHCIRV